MIEPAQSDSESARAGIQGILEMLDGITGALSSGAPVSHGGADEDPEGREGEDS